MIRNISLFSFIPFHSPSTSALSSSKKKPFVTEFLLGKEICSVRGRRGFEHIFSPLRWKFQATYLWFSTPKPCLLLSGPVTPLPQRFPQILLTGDPQSHIFLTFLSQRLLTPCLSQKSIVSLAARKWSWASHEVLVAGINDQASLYVFRGTGGFTGGIRTQSWIAEISFLTISDQKNLRFTSLCRDFTTLAIRALLLFLASHPQSLFGLVPDIRSLLYLKKGQITLRSWLRSSYLETKQPTERIISRSPFSAPNHSVFPREGKGFGMDNCVASTPSNGSITFIDPTNCLSITYRQSQYYSHPKKKTHSSFLQTSKLLQSHHRLSATSHNVHHPKDLLWIGSEFPRHGALSSSMTEYFPIRDLFDQVVIKPN